MHWKLSLKVVQIFKSGDKLLINKYYFSATIEFLRLHEHVATALHAGRHDR